MSVASLASGLITSQSAALLGGMFSGVAGANAGYTTNRTNAAIADERNKLERQMFDDANVFSHDEAQLARDFNAAEAEKSRSFNSLEAEKARQFELESNLLLQRNAQEYNSIGAQIQRAIAAGVNPAAVIGSPSTVAANSVGGVSASSSPAAGSPSPSSVSPPNLIVPPYTEPNVAGSIVSSIMEFAQIAKTLSEADLNKQKAGTEMTYRQYQKQVIESGIAKTNAEARLLWQKVNESQKIVDHTQQLIEESKAKIANLNADSKLKDSEKKSIDEDIIRKQFDNAHQDERYNYEIKQLAATLQISEEAADFAVQSHAARLLGVNLENKKSLSEIGLNQAQIGYFNKMGEMLEIQTGQAALDFTLSQEFGRAREIWNLKQLKENVSSAEFSNDPWVRGFNLFTQGVGSLCGIVTAGAGVGIARATLKRAAASAPVQVAGFK